MQEDTTSKKVFTTLETTNPFEGMTFESVSRYRLKHRLGEGGMGEVWLADRLSAGDHSQKVAVKFIRVGDAGQMLAKEALRISRLSHDNIVPFVDSGRDSNGRFFVAMAYVEGTDLRGLRELIGLTLEAAHKGEATCRIPDPLVGFLMFMVLRALHYAHMFDFGEGVVGLIHRDVSPGNILIDEAKGFVKLSDFGVAARQSNEAIHKQIAGKIPYMAPEVLIGRSVDTRSDIYALGLVAYELLTGFNPNIHPSQLSSVLGTITNVMCALEKPLRPPHEVLEGIDPTLSRIVARMLAAKPQDRYPSANAVIGDLVNCLYKHGVGPGSESLVSYMTLLRNPDMEPSPNSRLTFTTEKNDRLNIRPKWVLTPDAAEDLAADRNPGRIHNPETSE